MVQNSNEKILELSDQLKKQFIEESLQFSKKGGHHQSARIIHTNHLNESRNQQHHASCSENPSPENKERSKLIKRNKINIHMDEVSISLKINDDTEKRNHLKKQGVGF